MPMIALGVLTPVPDRDSTMLDSPNQMAFFGHRAAVGFIEACQRK